MSSLPTWPATPCYLSVSFWVLWWQGRLLSTPKAVPESASWLFTFLFSLVFEMKSIHSKTNGFQIHNLVIFILQHHADRHNHLIPEHFLPPSPGNFDTQNKLSPLVTNLSLPTAMDNQSAFPLWGFVYLGHPYT